MANNLSNRRANVNAAAKTPKKLTFKERWEQRMAVRREIAAARLKAFPNGYRMPPKQEAVKELVLPTKPGLELNQTLQESIVTLICLDDNAGRQIKPRLQPMHFSGDYKIFVERAYKYWDKYDKAPKAHVSDLVSDVLSKPENGRAKVFNRVIQDMYEFEPGINRKYIMAQLDDFIRMQTLNDVVIDSAKMLQRQDPQALEEIDRRLRQHLESRPQSTDEVQTFTLADLQQMEFDPVKYVVPGFVSEGLTLFAGKPKVGKSWLLLHVAYAVAKGGTTLGGIKVAGGDVYYAALEDNKRRLSSRARKLFGKLAWPRRLTIALQMPRLANGGIEQIRDWLKSVECPRLVIIDTLKMVRTPSRKGESTYEADYDSVCGLRDLAAEYGVAIIIVHHQRKADAEDVFDTISGTLGLTGAVDSIMVIWRQSGGDMTLACKGRDVEEVSKVVSFDKATCLWTVEGDADDMRMTATRESILSVLKDSDQPLTPKQLAEATGTRADTLRKDLLRMKGEGLVRTVDYGKYKLRTDNELAGE